MQQNVQFGERIQRNASSKNRQINRHGTQQMSICEETYEFPRLPLREGGNRRSFWRAFHPLEKRLKMSAEPSKSTLSSLFPKEKKGEKRPAEEITKTPEEEGYGFRSFHRVHMQVLASIPRKRCPTSAFRIQASQIP